MDPLDFPTADEQIRAYGDPNGLSRHSSPDGTPYTNREWWLKTQERSGQF
jgi:hypothetical protein